MYNSYQNSMGFNPMNRPIRRPIGGNPNRLIGGGFLGPFLLGGLTGGLVAPFFYGNNNYGYGRPNYYYNNYYYPYPVGPIYYR